MNHRHSLLAVLATSFALGAPARADDDSDASSWRSLTGQWWQWTLSTPADTNQVLDGSGAFCMVGQRGPVWFLGGTFTGQPTVRTCSVPDNVSLFFPVINRFTFNSPGCEQPDTDYSMAFMRSQIAPYIDGATGLQVLLDNRPFFGINCIVAGQVYSPAADDGYYVRLRPLPAGQHHLSIRGTDADGFTVDVFYTLNVVRAATR